MMGDWVVQSTALKVVRDKGVETVPDMNIKVSDLNAVNNTLYKNFYNQGYGGITFKVDVIIGVNDNFKGHITRIINKKVRTTQKTIRVVTALNYFIKNAVPLSVITKAIDVPNGVYIITGNSSRKQTYDKSTVWTLEFTTYNPFAVYTYKNDNAKVLEALGKKTTTKSLSALGQKLKYCDLKKLKYGYKNYCIRLVQLVLYKQGLFRKDHLNNVYDKYTASAIKNFQKRYQKQYNLKPTGKMSQATLNVMCWV